MSKARTAKRAAGKIFQGSDAKGCQPAHSSTKEAPSTPMVNCLKAKVVLRGSDGAAFFEWVEVANYHSDGGLVAFIDLMRSAPDDSFMTADAAGKFTFASVVAVRGVKDSGEVAVKPSASDPDAPKRTYTRLNVPIGTSGEAAVAVANVPWDENGLAHFAMLIGKYRDHDFVTEDFGFMPGRDVIPSRMTMPGKPPAARLAAMSPRDGVSLKDYPK